MESTDIVIAPRQFFTLPSWVPQPPPRTDLEESTAASEAPPESTAADEGEDDDKDKSTSTQGDEPESSVIMEESTITDGLTTRTDSGRTVTVPNNEIVTVTRHTTIVTDKPPPLPTSVTEPTVPPGSPSDPIPAPPPPVETSATDSTDGGAPLPTGAIIGVGVGGAAAVALLVIMIIFIKRRLKKRREEDAASNRNDEDFGRDDHDEKYFPQQMSRDTTGNTQTSADPFGPFGGRVDMNSQYPNRPASNTFEMDATPAAPVELPATDIVYPGPSTSPAPLRSTSTDTRKTDPRANLDQITDDDGNPKYINHWNQYRGMGSN